MAEWTEQFNSLYLFNWLLLESTPKWCDIENTMYYLGERNFIQCESSAPNILEQYGYIKNYVTIEKINEWAAKYKSKHVPFVKISLIVEYISNVFARNFGICREIIFGY